jgi:hypothetical protein
MDNTRTVERGPNIIPTADGDVEVPGTLLGLANSSRLEHNHATPFVRKGDRCSTCRYTEVRLFRDGDHYVLVTLGMTVIPGETIIHRIRRLTSPFEVLEVLTVRKPGREPFLSKSAALALAQAADVDGGIADAYVNRAVV